MAYYGIYSAGVAQTASDLADTVKFQYRSSNALTASTVLGLDGSDIIYVGTQGQTTTASANLARGAQGMTGLAGFTGGLLGDVAITAVLYGSGGNALTTDSTAVFTGMSTGVAYAANVDAVAVVTSQQGVRTLWGSQLYGNGGNDSIALGQQVTSLTGTTIGGGAGNDILGTFNQISAGAAVTTANAAAAGVYENSFLEGGGGDDTIVIKGAAVSLDLSATTIQGSQGNDQVHIATDGTAKKLNLFAGGGDDLLSAYFSGNGILTASTVAGGGGDDTVRIAGTAETNKSLILGDAFNSVTTFDGDDLIDITLSGVDASSNTIQGAAGADTISLESTTAAETNFTSNLVHLGQGNDIFSAGTSDFIDTTVQGGAGDDSVYFLSASLSSKIVLGGGNDLLDLNAANVVAMAAGSTVIGGQGADLFTAAAGGNANQGVRFQYSAGDSTLSAMDTIAIGGGSNTQFQFHYEPGSVQLANFATASTNSTAIASATNGVVEFVTDAPASLTARVEFLNQQVTTVGNVAIFNNENNNISYLFIQGGSVDTVAQIGTAGTVSGATLAVAGNNASFSATIA